MYTILSYIYTDSVATGETWIGKDAQAKGLCDGIGTVDDVLLDYRNKGHGLYSVKYAPKDQQGPFGGGGGGGGNSSNGSIMESIQDRVFSMFLQWIQQRLSNGGAGGSGGGLGGVTGGDGVWPPPVAFDHTNTNNSYTNSYNNNFNNTGVLPYISGLQGISPDFNSSDLPIQARAMAVIPSVISDIKL